MPDPIRIAIADDHTMFRESIGMLLDDLEDIQITISVGDGQELLDALQEKPADIILLDQKMPRLNGQATLLRLLEENPLAKVIILTFHDEPDIMLDLIRKGAKGYLLKGEPTSVLIKAIRDAHHGDYVFPAYVRDAMVNALMNPSPDNTQDSDQANEFTPREIEVLQIIGTTDRQGIARQLGVSAKAIDHHIKNLKEKTGCASTPELVRWAMMNKFQ